MLSILVVNPKGGCGKSTLATNLAGFYANAGRKVMLGDIDRQQSSLRWLAVRPPQAAGITGWQLQPGEAAKPPKNTEIVILDSPAGVHGKKLDQLLERVDRVIVPVQPSPFDIAASENFLRVLLDQKRIRKGKTFAAVVGMRVDPRTRAASDLEQFLSGYEIPVLTWLRNTQLYVQLAFRGLTLFDLPPARSKRDRLEWQPVLDWLRDGEN